MHLKLSSAKWRPFCPGGDGVNASLSHNSAKRVHTYLTHFPYLWADISNCRDHFVYAPSQWETTLHCNVISHWLGADVYAPSQWKTMLQCNVVSHWLDAYTKWSLQLYNGHGFDVQTEAGREILEIVSMPSWISWTFYHISHHKF